MDKSIPFDGTAVFWHVTPAQNALSILERGIDPRFSTGKMQASWYVSKHHIEWAAIHVSVAKHVNPDDLCIVACLAERAIMRKFFKAGFYYTFERLDAESVTPLMFFLHNQGVMDYE